MRHRVYHSHVNTWLIVGASKKRRAKTVAGTTVVRVGATGWQHGHRHVVDSTG